MKPREGNRVAVRLREGASANAERPVANGTFSNASDLAEGYPDMLYNAAPVTYVGAPAPDGTIHGDKPRRDRIAALAIRASGREAAGASSRARNVDAGN